MLGFFAWLRMHSVEILYGHAGPQTPSDRLLHPGMGHDGRCRLAGRNGRLAAARRFAGRNSGIHHRRHVAAAHRLCVWTAGHGDAGCRRRGRLHCQGFPAIGQLRHWLDDDAGVFHRLSVGGCGSGENRWLHFPDVRFHGTLPDRRETGIPATRDHWLGTDGFTDAVELSRHPPERDIPELDYIWNPGFVCGFRCIGRRQRFARKFSALVHPHSVRFGASGYADCPLLHDGL